MTFSAAGTPSVASSARKLRTPGQLCDALDILFSDEQLAIITSPLEPGVVIATAGSGKTTVMAARVVWLVGTGAVRADQVLGLTFTRKAAGELSHRVDGALLKARVVDRAELADAENGAVMTYDSFASRIVSEHAPRLGTEPGERLLSDASRYRLAGQVVSDISEPLIALADWSDRKLVAGLLKLDSSLSQHMVSGKELSDFGNNFSIELEAAPLWRGNPYKDIKNAQQINAERLELLHLVDKYRKLKKELGVTEFPDQMALAARLAEEVPIVSETLRAEFPVVLLDEYQDTSSAQARLLTALFSGADVEHGAGHAVTAVGDPYQGIYGWRGAAASNIAEFGRRFPFADGSPARTFPLTVNRRSGQLILAGANEMIAGLKDDPSMPHIPGMDIALRSAPDAPAAHIQSQQCETLDDELDWIADDIVARGEAWQREQGNRNDRDKWREIAVLVRRNSVIEPLFKRLIDRDIPVEIVGLNGLLSLEPISELVAMLRVLNDDRDNPAVVQLLSSRRWQLGISDLAALGVLTRQNIFQKDNNSSENSDQENGKEESKKLDDIYLMDVLTDTRSKLSIEGQNRAQQFAAEIAQLHRHHGEPLSVLVRRTAAVMGLFEEVSANPDWYKADYESQLGRFLQIVADFTDADGSATLSGFLAYLEQAEEQEKGLEQVTPSVDNAVKLMSIHKAKGLEWDCVYLPGLVTGAFPSKGKGENWITNPGMIPSSLRGDAQGIPQLGEVSRDGLSVYSDQLKQAGRFAEDRLAYVAMTRARRTLIATTHYWEPGLKQIREISPYFDVLDRLDSQKTDAVASSENGNEIEGEQTKANPVGDNTVVAQWPIIGDQLNQELLHASARQARKMMEKTSPDDSGNVWGVSDLNQWPWSELSFDEQDTVQAWARRAERLVQTARQRADDARRIPDLRSLSASDVVRSQQDPEGFAESILRPMPKPASSGASVGTRFHEWVERRFASAASLLIDDSDFESEMASPSNVADKRLQQLKEKFENSDYANLSPHQVEVPFVLVLGGRQIRGRIDAVYKKTAITVGIVPDWAEFQVVDWKTFDGKADSLQLALYRLAWAEATGTDPEQIDAIFFHVASGKIERPEALPRRDELAELLAHLSASNSDIGQQ